ncbi:MAG: HypC/HybG/HupF family hydrogenase formation chaperone [Desulfuromonadales bacterium]|nr:HypC/HybG/HupF family hydrogenase formation chaperone [Desulfuromonadales bacterium]MBN2791853.1 HypC/HybG/HupF family hydrogenase formation chaperone [Desulfuromonadales bacterium]
MCLAIPSKITAIDKETSMATVETMGVTRSANLALVEDEVSVGDWVLVHVGIAMSRIDENEARKNLDLFEDILREEDELNVSDSGPGQC